MRFEIKKMVEIRPGCDRIGRYRRPVKKETDDQPYHDIQQLCC